MQVVVPPGEYNAPEFAKAPLSRSLSLSFWLTLAHTHTLSLFQLLRITVSKPKLTVKTQVVIPPGEYNAAEFAKALTFALRTAKYSGKHSQPHPAVEVVNKKPI